MEDDNEESSPDLMVNNYESYYLNVLPFDLHFLPFKITLDHLMRLNQH